MDPDEAADLRRLDWNKHGVRLGRMPDFEREAPAIQLVLRSGQIARQDAVHTFPAARAAALTIASG